MSLIIIDLFQNVYICGLNMQSYIVFKSSKHMHTYNMMFAYIKMSFSLDKKDEVR